MKKLVASICCLFMFLCVAGVQDVKAEDLSIPNGNASLGSITDPVLKKFTADTLTIDSFYNQLAKGEKDTCTVYNTYKNYDVLYQQGTGINTLSEVEARADIDNNSISSRYPGGNYTLTMKVTNNPADSATFLETPQDFKIDVAFILKNSSGEEATVNMKLNAKVVKVEGTIINRTTSNKVDRVYKLEEVSTPETDPAALMENYHTKFQVKLLDGSIIDVVGMKGQRGGVINTDGSFMNGAFSFYDLKYVLEGAKHAMDYETKFYGYIIDKDNNIVDTRGTVIVPAAKRTLDNHVSNLPELGFQALQGTLPNAASIKATKRTDLSIKTPYLAYDINVYSNGENVQPVGAVNVAIPIPEELKGKNVAVYYLNDKGEFEEMTTVVKEDAALFDAYHFSTYVLMEKLASNPGVTPSKPNTSPGQVKTGDTTNVSLYVGMVVVSLGVVIYLKRKTSLSHK